MSGAVRNGDKHITGHLCTPAAFLALPIGNPPKVGCFINHRLACRMLDLDILHPIEVSINPLVCVPHAMPLKFGFPTVLVWGKPQSVIGSPIDFGAMVEGSKDTLICCASQGGFDTSTVSSKAGGGGLGDVGAGTKYA
jgi:hypothetical protein